MFPLIITDGYAISSMKARLEHLRKLADKQDTNLIWESWPKLIDATRAAVPVIIANSYRSYYDLRVEGPWQGCLWDPKAPTYSERALEYLERIQDGIASPQPAITPEAISGLANYHNADDLSFVSTPADPAAAIQSIINTPLTINTGITVEPGPEWSESIPAFAVPAVNEIHPQISINTTVEDKREGPCTELKWWKPKTTKCIDMLDAKRVLEHKFDRYGFPRKTDDIAIFDMVDLI